MFREHNSAFMHRANQYDQGDIFALGRNKDSKLMRNESLNIIMETNSIERNSANEHKTRVKRNNNFFLNSNTG